MAAPYSTDLRLKILTAYDRGFATAQIAEMFSVSPSWARRVQQRRREHGEVEPRPMGGARKIKIDRERLAQLVAEQPDATLAELCDRIEVECSRSGVEKALKSLDLTLKRDDGRGATDRPDIVEQRARWKEFLAEIDARRWRFE